MNKKYLILKKKVPKASFGTNIIPSEEQEASQTTLTGNPPTITGVSRFNNGTSYMSNNNQIMGGVGANPTMQGIDTAIQKSTNTLNAGTEIMSGLNSESDGSLPEGGKKKFDPKDIMGAASGLVNKGVDIMFADKIKEAGSTDGFGNSILTEEQRKLEEGAGAVKGLTSGFATGMQTTGNPLIAAAMGVGNAAISWIGARKKAKAQQKEEKEMLSKNVVGANKGHQAALTNALYDGKDGMKLGNFSLPKTNSKTLIMKTGGKLDTPGQANVVVKGKLHKENNNLGNKDKGIPVVDADGNKEYEVEEGEIIFRKETTNLVEDYANKYKETEDDTLLTDLGEILTKELLNNTQDNYGKFGAKIK